MKLLTIDTSTTACSVALTFGEQLIAEYLVNLEKHQSTRLLEVVDAVLKGAGQAVEDLDGFAVALGPGSFTGVRIGVASVKALALAAGKPVAGFSSLAMLAMNLPWAAHAVCPMFDARKKEVYTALYDCRDLPAAMAPDCVVPPDLFLENISGPAIFVGDGALAYRELISNRLGTRAIFAPFHCHQPRAAKGAHLARTAFARGETIPLHSLLPVYIRPSEAEVTKLKKGL